MASGGDSTNRPAVRWARLALLPLAAWILFAAWWMLLVDLATLPELLVGVAVVTVAVIGVELARRQEVAGIDLRWSWLLRVYRPALRVPRDLAALTWAALV